MKRNKTDHALSSLSYCTNQQKGQFEMVLKFYNHIIMWSNFEKGESGIYLTSTFPFNDIISTRFSITKASAELYIHRYQMGNI